MDLDSFLRRYYATYNSEDPDALSDFYDPDVRLYSAQEPMIGRDAVLDTYRHLIALFRDQMEPTHIEVNNDTAEVTLIDRFTAREDVDDFMGMQIGKGKTLEMNLRGRYTVHDGKIVEIRIEMLSA